MDTQAEIKVLKSSSKVAEWLETSVKAQQIKNRGLYPFDTLEAGQSFSVAYTESRAKSLQVLISKQNNKRGSDKFFKAFEHMELNPPLIEVARIE